MPRFKAYDYRQKVFVPVSLEEQLVPGTLEYAIHHLLEERVDDSWFSDLYRNDTTGRRAYPPKLLLKVILLGYARGLFTSRRLERACRENITFMALSCGEQPDHSTFAEFVGKLSGRIAVIFSEVLLVCHEEGLLGGTHFALDGLKLPSNASREWSGTHEDLRKKQKKLEEKLRAKVLEHQRLDRAEAAKGLQPEEERERKRQEDSIKRLRRKAERIAEFLKENAPRQGVKAELQSNVTDNDSSRMHTGHGTIQGYNAQALVDSANQIIVQPEARSEGQDSRNVAPLLEGAKETLELAGLSEALPISGAVFLADCSCHSEGNLRACQEHGLDAYIPDVRYRQRDARFATKERHRPKRQKKKEQRSGFFLEHFDHDPERDCYICPQGKELKLYTTARDPHGNRYKRYCARKEDCQSCPLRKQCLSFRGKRRSLHVPQGKLPEPQSLSQAMQRKIDQEESRKIYGQRLAIVEPVFANLRYCKGLGRFTYRGKEKVNTQWILFCLVHNLEKIAHLTKRYSGSTGPNGSNGFPCSVASTLLRLRAALIRLMSAKANIFLPQPAKLCPG